MPSKEGAMTHLLILGTTEISTKLNQLRVRIRESIRKSKTSTGSKGIYCFIEEKRIIDMGNKQSLSCLSSQE